MCNTRAWPQQCWRSYANGPNIVVLCLGEHGTCDRLPTTCGNVQEGLQTDSGSNVRALVLLTFMGNVNKRQHLKIFLKCDKIWQKSCSYQTSVNEGLK